MSLSCLLKKLSYPYSIDDCICVRAFVRTCLCFLAKDHKSIIKP